MNQGKNLNRLDLVQDLVDEYGYTKKAATAIIDDFKNIVLKNMREGNTITIRGFGCFDFKERKARSCPNPQTGERCEIPTPWVPKFYPGKAMRRAGKLWEDDLNRGIR